MASPTPGSGFESLAARIRSKEAVVGVVGLGYVGLPLLVTVQNAGYATLGIDTDEQRIASLRAGRSYLVDVTDTEAGLLEPARVSTDPRMLRRADVLVICVPTPLRDQAPDLTYVRGAAEVIGKNLSPGKLVILESTTYPGTTEEELCPILEKHSGLTVGIDLAVAYSPERVNPGQSDFGIEDIPKVVGGITDTCRDLAALFYQSFVQSVTVTSSPREAEMAKLIENTFRHVNIALVNELAMLAREMDVDIWEAIRAAASKPFGFMPFWPGPGVGGHCIPIDPSYLSWRANQRLGYSNGFIEHANEVNRRMPAYVTGRIAELMNRQGKALKGVRVLAIGAAYKPGVADMRESPAVDVMKALLAQGVELAYHDPLVEEVTIGDKRLRSVSLEEQEVGQHDCVVILTPHPDIDWRRIAKASRLLFDTRGVTTGITDSNVARL